MTGKQGLQRRRIAEGRPIESVSARWMRHAGAGVVGLGVVGLLLASDRCVAQTIHPPEEFSDFVIRNRMDLRPHELATGTRTERAGWIKLEGDSISSYTRAYVPPSCVGTRRCPLLLHQQPNPEDLMPMADKYGIITCAVGFRTDNLEILLRTLLRQFAIDPDRIAAAGFSFGSASAFSAVAKNLHIFSRVALVSYGPLLELSALGPANKTTQFYVGEGLLEAGEAGARNELTLRRLGYPVKHVVRLDGHDFQQEEFLNWGEWLVTSWAVPDSSARPAPQTVAEVLLTPQAVNQMATFWSRFMLLPDSIRHTARRAHLQEYAVPVSPNRRVSVLMMDVATMAQQHFGVADALHAAGLTAEQHQAYRVALIGARYIRQQSPWLWAPTLEPTSVLGQNVAFLAVHPCELHALAVTNMWTTP